MDPKALSALDPKMKETYDRVMGTIATPKPMPMPGDPVSPPPTGAPGLPPLPTQPVQPLSQTPPPVMPPLPGVTTPPVTAPLGTASPSLPVKPPLSVPLGTPPVPAGATPSTPPLQTPHPLTMPTPAAPLKTPMTTYQASPNLHTTPLTHPVMEEKKSSLGKVLIFTLLGLIFFAVYGVFWLKFLNFPLPF